MSGKLFEEGGPYRTRRTGSDEYTMKIDLPVDADGLVGRECTETKCSPGYFKVKLGTGITGTQKEVFCPYCRKNDKPNNFHTKEQIRYGKDIVIREAKKGISKTIKDALGLGPSGKKRFGGGFISMEMSYKQGSLPNVRPPLEEELRRDVTCPNCGLEHAVFGLATWCSDCGKDIFMTHVQEEFAVVMKMLGDIERRGKELGPRVAARDIENALEDVVSIFESVLRALTRRHMKGRGIQESDIDEVIRKKIRNRYQNIELASDACKEILCLELYGGIHQNDVSRLKQIFEKRHPITHNLGVVDRKYLEKARSGELVGRDVRVTSEEISWAIDLCMRVFRKLHSRLFIDGK